VHVPKTRQETDLQRYGLLSAWQRWIKGRGLRIPCPMARTKSKCTLLPLPLTSHSTRQLVLSLGKGDSEANTCRSAKYGGVART
jgi:hypothetical protein